LIGQLGADSLYTADNRIPLNYMTLASTKYTNFVPETLRHLRPPTFLTQRSTADERVLWQKAAGYSDLSYESVHSRCPSLFQLTANIYDAMTNQAPGIFRDLLCLRFSGRSTARRAAEFFSIAMNSSKMSGMIGSGMECLFG
jgi:hypothetical protein